METEGLGWWIKRQFLNVLDVLIDSGGFRLSIDSRLGKLAAYLNNVGIEVDLDDGGDQSYIFIVCDSASVVNFCSQKVEYFVGYFLVLIKQHFELFLADHKIFVGELVSDVPTDGSEFTPILHNGVEEAESE